ARPAPRPIPDVAPHPARLAIVACLLSRVVVFLAGFAWVSSAGEWSRSLVIRDPRYAEALHGVAGRLTDTWAHWDGVWFVRIASRGYAHPDSAVFFPLYPLLMHVLAPLTGGDYVIAGLVISLAAYGIAMVLLYKLTAKLFDPSVAVWTVVLISWFPTSTVFSAVYSESLFLMLTLAAFWFATRHSWALAGLAAFLAALTRNSGILLVVPLLLLYVREAGWSLRRVRLRWPQDLRLAWLLLAPAGLLTYAAYLKVVLGNALAFSTSQANWHRYLNDPFGTVYDGGRKAIWGALRIVEGHASVAAGHQGYAYVVYAIAPFLALVFVAALIVLGWRRLPAAYTAWALIGLTLPLFYPTVMRPLYSFHRFALIIFPVFIVEALVTKDIRWLRWTLLAGSAVGMLLFTFAFAWFAAIG
ncbi:MAG TPA: mannosyltransferase family protein, partial [Thermoleophilia bacterium]|nr:mannosyltransferase family protein [Thermoleophilia bacterium]